MEQEKLMRDLKVIDSVLSITSENGEGYLKWFLSFGSLLYAIRDKDSGGEFTQDIDISILGSANFEKIKTRFEENGFQMVTHIRNDITGTVYFADFKSKNGLSVDLFFWVEYNGHLWHTYDYMAERPKDGVPKKYHFKSLPKWMFSGDTYKYFWFQEISPLKIPNKYGTLLDYWYPHWYIPNNEFGVSVCEKIVEPKTCRNLEMELYI